MTMLRHYLLAQIDENDQLRNLNFFKELVLVFCPGCPHSLKAFEKRDPAMLLSRFSVDGKMKAVFSTLTTEWTGATTTPSLYCVDKMGG